MKDILVTGAAGQLGVALAHRQQFHPQLKLHLTTKSEIDIRSMESISHFLTDNQFYAVINCAAYTAVDLAEANRDEAFLVNATGAENLARVCKSTSIKLWHVSTDYVFDGEANRPYTEEDKVNPINAYGESKAEGERLIMKENPEAVILRTSWLVSPDGQNFVNTMKRLGRERANIQVVDDQTASPTWAPLLAEGILRSLENETQLTGIYHFAHKGDCTWKDFAEFIFAELGIDCVVEPVSTSEFAAPAKRPKFSKLNTNKLQALGDFSFPTWQEASRQYLHPTE